MAELSEIEEFNLRRAAIQNTITWSFEMWRRERQAQWESEMTEAEMDLRAKLESDLVKERDDLEKAEHTAKLRLREKQSNLAEAISVAQKEAAATEKLMAAVQEAHEKAKEEYDKATAGIKTSLDKRRSLILQKLAAAQARTSEMEQRAAFFKTQWMAEEERLKAELAAFDARKQEILSNNSAKTRKDIDSLRSQLQDTLSEIRELELARMELMEQCQRAARLEAQFIGAQGVRMSDDLASVTSDISNPGPRMQVTGPAGAEEASVSDLSVPTIIVTQREKLPPLNAYSIDSTTQPDAYFDSLLSHRQASFDDELSGSAYTHAARSLSALSSNSVLNPPVISLTVSDPLLADDSASSPTLQPTSLDPNPDASTLNAGPAAASAAQAVNHSLAPPQTKAMGELSRKWRKTIEDEAQLARILSRPCVGPYHRLYGMSRIHAQEAAMHNILTIDARAFDAPFTLYLCSAADSAGIQIILITTKPVSVGARALEVWGPWSTFNCGIYFRPYFRLSNAKEPPSVLFNPSTVVEWKG